jgi:hypothetical protein
LKWKEGSGVLRTYLTQWFEKRGWVKKEEDMNDGDESRWVPKSDGPLPTAHRITLGRLERNGKEKMRRGAGCVGRRSDCEWERFAGVQPLFARSDVVDYLIVSGGKLRRGPGNLETQL